MDEKFTGGCTGNCHTCGSGSSCDTGERKPSFFDTLENLSEHFSNIGEDNLIQILNDTVAEWEKEDEKGENDK